MFAKEEFNIYALSLDPVYIGTGGYTIGRVDNTIVRDTITKIPKIPATSLAGTWRYYTALTLQGFFKEKFEDIRKILNYNDTVTPRDVRELVNRLADKHLKDEKRNKFAQRMDNFQKYANRIKEEMQENKNQTAEQSDSIEWKLYWGNLISSIKCAGQDDKPNDDIEDVTQKELRETGHCGHCIVCKAFGFSKNESQQGLVFFSDLNILFFPVNTRFGVRWITSPSLLREAGFGNIKENIPDEKIRVLNLNDDCDNQFLNLGWLNFEVKVIKKEEIINKSMNPEIHEIISDKLIIVSDNMISQIINANLEVRTSVSIDPLTGAAKKGALFTSEAIPRGTVFYGNVRIMDRLPEDVNSSLIKDALKESKIYYESFGIGGLVTRGFGRLKIYFES